MTQCLKLVEFDQFNIVSFADLFLEVIQRSHLVCLMRKSLRSVNTSKK